MQLVVKDISVNIRLYADDCVLYEKMTSIENQTTLNNFTKVTKWCEEWQMQIMKKTVYTKITLKKASLQLERSQYLFIGSYQL